jgi:hypothetical protein
MHHDELASNHDTVVAEARELCRGAVSLTGSFGFPPALKIAGIRESQRHGTGSVRGSADLARGLHLSLPIVLVRGGSASKWRFAALCLVGVAGACTQSLEGASNDSELGGGATGGTGGSLGTGGTGAAGGGTPIPPETENEDTYSAPVVSGRWIWTANPLSGRVALIDTTDLTVTTSEAGLLPTYLASLPSSSEDEAAAIVLNVGSNDATLLHAVSGEIDTKSVRVHENANRLSVSPGGRWAVIWSDAALIENEDPTEGLQDVTVIDLAADPPRGRRLTVGYRPSRVAMGEDDRHAYVVAEPGVSVIDLPEDGTPNVIRDVSVSADPSEAASARDVTVTKDGELALVRRTDSADVEVVSLTGGGTTRITLPGVVTDLDLSPDGSLAFAVVRGGQVMPPDGSAGSAGSGGASGEGGETSAEAGAAGASELGGAGGEDSGTGGTAGGGGAGPVVADSHVAIIPIPGVLTRPGDVRSVRIPRVVGSVVVAPSGDVALLYTNAVDDPRVTILHYENGADLRTVDVQAPVKSVLPSPDGEHAVALLGAAPGSRRPGGFSLIPVANDLPPKIVGADAPPLAVAVGPTDALITISGPREGGATLNGVYLAKLPELSTELVSLGSKPISTALVPAAGVGFVAQAHPEGRITFVSLETGAPRTLTGFELAAGVIGRD